MAEGVGFEPTVELPLLLISSQMPLTTQPPFQPLVLMTKTGVLVTANHYPRIRVRGKLIWKSLQTGRTSFQFNFANDLSARNWPQPAATSIPRRWRTVLGISAACNTF
jgi:hypothetical protein